MNRDECDADKISRDSWHRARARRLDPHFATSERALNGRRRPRARDRFIL
jgi:hypothetical protein